jgi:hypothetical protein
MGEIMSGIGKERIMSKNVKVLFWKDSAWNKGTLPTREDIEQDYVELPITIHRTNLDSIYSLLNSGKNPLSEPYNQKWIRERQIHSSMSVGDIVMLGENDYYISTNLGWQKLEA